MPVTSIVYHRVVRLRILALLALLLLFATPAYADDDPYIVQPGDTLSEIAKAHDTDVDALRRLNGLGNVDFVWVGQHLILPARIELEATTATDAASAEAEAQTTLGSADNTADDALALATGAVSDTDLSVPEPLTDEIVTSTDEAAAAPTGTETARAETTVVDPEELPEAVVSRNEKTDIYVVEAGDTLSQIAVRYRTTLAHLIEFNQISPAQRLKPGQALVVPVAGDAVATIQSIEPVVHVVQPGEALSTIAKEYAVATTSLARANGIADSGFIVPGQQLVIPNPAEPGGLGSIRMGSDGFHVHTVFPTTTEKWIDVDLSEQRLVAYRGHKPVKTFIISSGLPGTPTVTGTFRIWAKTPVQDMYAGNRAAGYSYYINDVPWVQYFYKDYGFHGAYWHNNFGQPMSHGCVNMRNDDAKWLFAWASPTMSPKGGWFISDDENPGTLVIVHD